MATEKYVAFTRADWVGMKAAKITKTLSDGKTIRPDTKAIADVIAQYLVDEASVDTELQFADRGLSLDALIHKVCGLPEKTSLEAKEVLGAVIKSRLAGTSVGDVQVRLGGSVNKWLITGSFLRTITDIADGVNTTVPKKLWAVTTSEDLVHRYAAAPAHKRVLLAEFGNLRDAKAQIQRIPALAARLVVLQRQRVELVSLAQDRVYTRAIENLSDADRAAFDAQVAQLVLTMAPDITDIRKAIEAA